MNICALKSYLCCETQSCFKTELHCLLSNQKENVLCILSVYCTVLKQEKAIPSTKPIVILRKLGLRTLIKTLQLSICPEDGAVFKE